MENRRGCTHITESTNGTKHTIDTPPSLLRLTVGMLQCRGIVCSSPEARRALLVGRCVLYMCRCRFFFCYYYTHTKINDPTSVPHQTITGHPHPSPRPCPPLSLSDIHTLKFRSYPFISFLLSPVKYARSHAGRKPASAPPSPRRRPRSAWAC